MPLEVLWRGPLFGVSGYAQEGREFVLGLDALGAHIRAEDVPLGPHRSPLEASAQRRLRELTNAQVGPGAIRIEHGLPSRWAASARAGRTLFETDRIPAAWIAACNSVEELWVPSGSTSRLSQPPASTPSGSASFRVQYGSLAGAATIGCSSPCPGLRSSQSSTEPAQRWDLLLAAYTDEFGNSDDVVLVLNIHSPHGHSATELRRLIERAAGREAPPILVLDRPLSAADMPRLYRAADCFVLPTRGEGLGTPVPGGDGGGHSRDRHGLGRAD